MIVGISKSSDSSPHLWQPLLHCSLFARLSSRLSSRPRYIGGRRRLAGTPDCEPVYTSCWYSHSSSLYHHNLVVSSTTTPVMSQTSSTIVASSRFQDIFNAALNLYHKQTKRDLIVHPLASQLQSCNSIDAILAVLQDQVREFDQAHRGDERLTKWLVPTVNVLYAFSAAVSEGVGLAAKDVAASKDVLAELFERIGFFFSRLETYTEVTPTAAMTKIITEIMVEVLTIFGIATKELRRGSAILEEIGWKGRSGGRD
ncbi:hypothetical protein EDB87DRAFT_398940 [Lactarius vividus]|nr:hypothetical protein EDB87DRAFT_398940 [Lactarius vividus]